MRGILLAEDNPADVYLIREALRECGLECPLRVASDGGDVLRVIDDWPGEGSQFGLIILDLNLPRHDGIEIMERLREVPELCRIPVAVLTSSDSPRDRAIAAQLGAACFLRKPSNLEEFLDLGAVFKNLLEQSEGVRHANGSSD